MAANVADLFEHAVDTFPERVAVVLGDREASYGELEERANRLANYLAGRGVGPGSHVALYGRNSIELVTALLAVYKLRAVAINTNYRYVENELRYLWRNADVTALVHDREFADKVAAVLPDVPELTTAVVIDDGTDADIARYGGVELETALAGASPERAFGPRSADDIYILYTGGTTGYPKGVMWRHEDVWRALGGGVDFYTGIPMEDEWSQSRRGKEMGIGMVRMCLAPLIHGNAQWAALAALFAGDTVVFVPRFDPDEIWRTVERRKVNVMVLIGDAMARPLMETYAKGGYDGSTIFAMSSSAALLSRSIKEQIVTMLPNILLAESIGSSEVGWAGTGYTTVDSVAEGAADGPRVTPHEAVVIDEFNRPVAPGTVGRLAKGGHLPIGYYKDPEKTAATFIEVDGVRYGLPGDLARLEEDGTITLLGRGNTCVNTGGEKVFPEEVEAALKEHPDVFDALVIGVPDERLGQRVAALIQFRPGQSADIAGIEAFLRERVAGYKVPRTVWFVDEMGRTLAGKADYPWAHRYAREQPPAHVS